MDLEARAREFFAAHRDLRTDRIMAFVAPVARVEYVGALEPLDRAGIERTLQAMHDNLEALGMDHLEFRIGSLMARRNVTFVEWTCEVERGGRRPVTYAGVHVISWDRDGLLTDAAVYTDPEPIRRLAVGSHALPSVHLG